MGMKKNFTILFKLMLPVMVAFFMGTNVSEGQSVVYDLANQQSEFSIVRHYVDYIDITYSYYLSNERCFCYIDRYNNEYYKADVDLDLGVVDFRIFGDYVYFCGTYRTNSVIGWFKISDLFFGSGSIKLVSMLIYNNTYPIFEIPGYDVDIEGSRLKVFERNGDLHLVMVGSGLHQLDDKGVADTIDRPYYVGHSVIIDVWTNDHLSWNIYYTMDYNDKFIFDDIAVTENYVVVTARYLPPQGNSYSPHILYYPLPAVSNSSIFGSLAPNITNAAGFTSDNIFIQSQSWAPYLISEMERDRFVTMCEAVAPNSNVATVVTYYQNPVSSPVARYVYSNAHAIGYYKEIRYNQQNSFLYLLRLHEDFVERLGPPFINANIISSYYSGMSIDVLDRVGSLVVSGTDVTTDYKKLWMIDESHLNNCITITNVSVATENVIWHSYPDLQFFFEGAPESIRLQARVNRYGMMVKCE